MQSPQALVDIGVNLTHKSFRRHVDAVLERARAAGVDRMVLTGTSVTESSAASELASQYPGRLFSTAGVHPHDAKSCDENTLSSLRELLALPHVVAVGECGLDFDRDFSPRPVQLQWCEAQVELACELGMPLFLHEREATEPMLEILRRHRSRITDAVIHCFTGSEEALDAYLELDLHIGVTGWICDERRGTHLHGLMERIPLERLMVETDAPYLIPRNIRPRPKGSNEPAYLPYVVDQIAECLGVDIVRVAAATTRTAERFFGIGEG